MKILVLSDSHGTMQYMCDAVEKEQPDCIIHLGDHAKDAEELSVYYPKIPVSIVRGNCDRFSNQPETRFAVYDGVKIFSCHGHTYGVKGGLLRAVYAAREADADILLYGHTHIPLRDESDGLMILNPGTCGNNNSFGKPSYGIIETGRGKTAVKYDFL